MRARGFERRPLLVAGAQLAGLSGFALAQPLFDLLSRNVEFLAVRGSTRAEILVFAVGVVLLPPAALLAAEAVAAVVSERLRRALHLLFVAALVALVVLQALSGTSLGDAPAFLVAGIGGTAAAAAFALVRPARMLATVLSGAPLVFLGLFLFASPVSRLVLATPPEARTADVDAQTPVVVAVFDELPLNSLLRPDGGIDGVRYPSFDRLARASTWFRNTSTVHEWTTSAVPAILTGRYPDANALPIYLDHPDNLFTLLGGGYRLHTAEPMVRLCPAELCDQARGSFAERMDALLSDLGVVYLHLTLPENLRARVPSVAGQWGNFRGAERERRRGRAPMWIGRDLEFRRFLGGIRGGGGPTLHYVHSLLPHHPWEYLPSGRRYPNQLTGQPGLVDERWAGDPWLAAQAWQRHLLQTAFTDLLLGKLLDRLERTGLWDRALVVVIADHGVSFDPHGERRRAVSQSLDDVAFVPLFVKTPNQRRPHVVERHVRTIDVLPTIADLLGVEIPWRIDGRSVLRPGGEARNVVVYRASGERIVADAEELELRARAALARRIELFGWGNEPPGLYRAGPHPELVGRSVPILATADDGATRVHFYGHAYLAPGSPVVPARIAGHLDGPGAEAAHDIAIAVGGRIWAVSRSFRLGGRMTFSALVPEEAFDPGENEVSLFLVGPDGRLERVRTA